MNRFTIKIESQTEYELFYSLYPDFNWNSGDPLSWKPFDSFPVWLTSDTNQLVTYSDNLNLVSKTYYGKVISLKNQLIKHRINVYESS